MDFVSGWRRTFSMASLGFSKAPVHFAQSRYKNIRVMQWGPKHLFITRYWTKSLRWDFKIHVTSMQGLSFSFYICIPVNQQFVYSVLGLSRVGQERWIDRWEWERGNTSSKSKTHLEFLATFPKIYVYGLTIYSPSLLEKSELTCPEISFCNLSYFLCFLRLFICRLSVQETVVQPTCQRSFFSEKCFVLHIECKNRERSRELLSWS